MFTDEKTKDHRENTCNACPSKNGVRCGECGCFLMYFRKVTSAKCPLNKW